MTLPLELSIRVKALLEGGNESEYRITAKPNETVGDFRERLATTSTVEPQKQRLIFQGRLLSSDSQKLSDAGLRDGCALHMVARPSNIPPQSSSSPNTTTTINAEENAAASSLPPGMSPLAGHIMHQTLLRRIQNRRQRPIPTTSESVLGGGIPFDFQQELASHNGISDIDPAVVRYVWGDHNVSSENDIRIVVNGRTECYVVNRQVEVNDRLTDEELSRGPVAFPAASFFSTGDRSVYQPLDNLPSQVRQQPTENSDEDTSRQPPGHHFIYGVASRAQINELNYHLFANVLPNLRRMPGHGDYNFGLNEPQRPTFLTSTSTADDARALAGQTLGMVGDAFVEIGRSLQAIGQHYNDDSQNSSDMYSADDILAVVDSMYHLVLTAPMAVPFLQPINSRTATRRDSTTAGTIPGGSISFISQPIVIPLDGSSSNNGRMPPPPPPPFVMSGMPVASWGDVNATGGAVRPENFQHVLEAHISLGNMFSVGANGGNTSRPDNNNNSGNQQQQQQQRGNAFAGFLDRLGALNNPGRRQRATSRGDAASATSTTTESSTTSTTRRSLVAPNGLPNTEFFRNLSTSNTASRGDAASATSTTTESSTTSTTRRPLVAPNGLPNTEFFRNLSTSNPASRAGTSGQVRQRSDSGSDLHAADGTESSSSSSLSSGKRHRRE